MSPLGGGGNGEGRHLDGGGDCGAREIGVARGGTRDLAAGRAAAAGASGGSLAPDAAMALGIAATAMPFTRTRQAAVEHWLRVLRLHGQAGAALQSLGVGEARIQAASTATAAAGPIVQGGADEAGIAGGDPVAAVAEMAGRIARRRSETAITTADLLLAVIDLYGNDCDRVLRLHGTDRAELIDRLAREAAPAGCDGA